MLKMSTRASGLCVNRRRMASIPLTPRNVMSMTTICGSRVENIGMGAGGILRLPDDGDVALPLQQSAIALANHGVIVHEQHAYPI